MDIKKTVLLEIDVQNDFCPGGALAVDRGDAVIAPINAAAAALFRAGGRVAATQDWHPAGHISFASAHAGKKAGDTVTVPGGGIQALWPDHCVQGQHGSSFHEKLDLRPVSLIIRKGCSAGLDSYSAFFENDRKTPTGLAGWLRGLTIETVVLGGLATDYCVFYSAMDAKNLDFQTIVLSDAIQGVGFPEGSVEKATAEMKAAGITFTGSAEFIGGL
ncbi:MAG: bifunctional nicotinamidase/pyrazinamidase [Treponema sp.]|jgi:nicotinamidase/pyrazinamidase|nr:bifunctional nicotinamidase/pyrazinamidase [Treponema sp.]